VSIDPSILTAFINVEISMLDGAREHYFTAEEAARELGVSLTTLYAYVSRKGIRTEKLPGQRERLYWKADVMNARGRRSPAPAPDAQEGVSTASKITFMGDDGPYYRGQNAVHLSEDKTVEEVAGLLWDVDPTSVFTGRLPHMPQNYAALMALVDAASASDRATVALPFLEEANPRAFDLSPTGMATTGADLLRLLSAVLTRDEGPSTEAIHLYIGRRLGLDAAWTDVARQLLILSADHGLASGTYAVRAVASVGVSPFRCILTGLALSSGRRTRFGRFDGLSRLLNEICASPDPAALIISRHREGDGLPGFGFSSYAGGDPRAVALLASFDKICGGDEDYRRLSKAIATVEDVRGEKPDFALMAMFATRRMRMDPRDSLFLIGRSIGWVAHAIEQYQMGELHRANSAYVGKLPPARR
jgi:citrate synthase